MASVSSGYGTNPPSSAVSVSGPLSTLRKDPLCFPFLEPSVQFICRVFLYVIKQCTEQMCLNHRILNVFSVDCLILLLECTLTAVLVQLVGKESNKYTAC